MPSDSNPFSITVTPPGSPDKSWLYFKGNGHDTGRNGSWDRIDLQRYFYITKDAALDPWANGMTIVWQIIPIRHSGYYTTFFFAASSGTTFSDLDGFIGCHPYPHSAFGDSSGEDFTRHKWEISTDSSDFTSHLVDYGRLHTQALIYETNNRATFYTDILSTTNVVKHSYTAMFNNGYHVNAALVFGNAPWWGAHQHERLSGFIRRIKVFNAPLSEADTLNEALSDDLVSGNNSNLWWSKIDFSSADDLASDFGVARSAAWIDSHRADVVLDSNVASHPAMAAPATIQSVHQERGT